MSLCSGSYKGSSFFDLLRQDFPHMLPLQHLQHLPHTPPGESWLLEPGPHATTILALSFADGVVMAGDRQATEGFEVSSRRIEKLYNADNHSVVGMAGVAGPCLDMAKLFQVEMEHYEKIEGGPLALEGKANRLAQMVKQNLPAAFQGLVVVPIFAGYDNHAGQGRIFKYDVTGGRYEERQFYSTGSGGKEARSTLRKGFRDGLSRSDGIALALEALVDAADIDVGTSGPDRARGIYPLVKIITCGGTEDVADKELASMSGKLLSSMKG